MSVSTHWWRGADGRWFLHTIYPINAVPDLGACNYIAACPLADGLRRPLYIGETGDGGERFPRHEKLGPAIRLGATELHVYLGARSRRARLDIETALRNVHRTPLNDQPTAAPPYLGIMAGLINRTASNTGGIAPARNALADATPGFGGLGMAGLINRNPFDTDGIASPAPRNALADWMAAPPTAGFGAIAAALGYVPEVRPPARNALADWMSAPPRQR